MWKHVQSRAILGIGVLLGGALAGSAQEPVPPGVQPPMDLNRTAELMAERVRRLGEDIAADMGAAPAGRQLAEDTRELAQAVDEFRETVRRQPDAFRLRQSYSGIDATWHHLRAQLARPGGASPAVDRSARRVDELDVQLHQALGLNALPNDYYSAEGPPAGPARTQQLAHALVDRAEALAAAIRTGMAGGPQGPVYADQAMQLAREADAFHDAIDINGRPEVVARSFGPVAAQADRLEADLAAAQCPPAVVSAWRGFASTVTLIRQDLGLPVPPPQFAAAVQPPPGTAPPGGPAPAAALADRLVVDAEAFLQVFSRTAGVTPEGGFFLADAQRLRDAAVNFRDDVARNADPNRVAFEFRDVDIAWQRLARRTERIARGRTGPNIQQVQKMGGTISELHQILGAPGYPPTFTPAAGVNLP